MSSNYDAIVDLDPPIDTPEAQLEFQNFILSEDQKNVSGKVNPQRAGPSSGADFGFTAPPPQQQQTQAAPQARGGFWTVEYYSQYFNVDTTDVGQRIVATVIPKQKFADVLGTNPDLYGPFWIATTVIFALFATSTVAGWINHKEYTYDMTLLSLAVSTVYVYTSVVPLVLWGVLKYFKGPANLLELIDMYGYALAAWIPVSLLCIIPSEIVRWVLVAVAFASSVLFKIRTVRPIITQTNDKRASTLVLSIIVLCHGALVLLFKFVFFRFVISV
ncbi:uncharacterized protein SPPG_04489 [Spizellomyces punctatus DAOM BR117]|uniref:Protein YIP n=1 Tax=Spizellomyces punctatus (strain DAOM BR117) TaxID=645134 RepID=A0A0L0HGD8_SPIPD|nr:uncharacterized protein SPPG_04489 [Spizellomyces punctatus DAOM BR117]KND00148.1 hypothetical protein SPPG_04489 [Spizellomyces punctatus DAOM BR117]|eukprot:XP_016608187.1 hypothetical protein SPPG_04489 [Spizellomyces punctatus DAOM BR117]